MPMYVCTYVCVTYISQQVFPLHMPSFIPPPTDTLNFPCDLSFSNNNKLLINALCIGYKYAYTHTHKQVVCAYSGSVCQQEMNDARIDEVYLFIFVLAMISMRFFCQQHIIHTHTNTLVYIHIYIFNAPNIAGTSIRYIQFIFSPDIPSIRIFYHRRVCFQSACVCLTVS